MKRGGWEESDGNGVIKFGKFLTHAFTLYGWFALLQIKFPMITLEFYFHPLEKLTIQILKYNITQVKMKLIFLKNKCIQILSIKKRGEYAKAWNFFFKKL